jgi:hypothetical protein
MTTPIFHVGSLVEYTRKGGNVIVGTVARIHVRSESQTNMGSSLFYTRQLMDEQVAYSLDLSDGYSAIVGHPVTVGETRLRPVETGNPIPEDTENSIRFSPHMGEVRHPDKPFRMKTPEEFRTYHLSVQDENTCIEPIREENATCCTEPSADVLESTPSPGTLSSPSTSSS